MIIRFSTDDYRLVGVDSVLQVIHRFPCFYLLLEPALYGSDARVLQLILELLVFISDPVYDPLPVVVPVPSGQHSVAIVCKTSARNASKIKIENRDLIVLEMRR